MYSIEYLPHVADIRLKITADNLKELFESALKGMSNLLKTDFCNKNTGSNIVETITITSIDTTSLLIDFLSEVLTISYLQHAVFCETEWVRISDNEIEVKIKGSDTEAFDEDIKAVTYHEAEIKRNPDGLWETIIIFDI